MGYKKIKIFVAVDCFLPGRAKDLSAFLYYRRSNYWLLSGFWLNLTLHGPHQRLPDRSAMNLTVIS